MPICILHDCINLPSLVVLVVGLIEVVIVVVVAIERNNVYLFYAYTHTARMVKCTSIRLLLYVHLPVQQSAEKSQLPPMDEKSLLQLSMPHVKPTAQS